ncbi:hypothetical protein VNI00_009773 [Paramarasmius palmivorus]|uniref:Transmembrane protein n=1 Tax=Paramarasmius palmivorus TaxID=297713 RepID=A0AAW0CP43_9AGAR
MELVDDRDPRVKFQPDGAWVMGGGEYEHSGTTHGTASGNAAMVFQFSGLSWIAIVLDTVAHIPGFKGHMLKYGERSQIQMIPQSSQSLSSPSITRMFASQKLSDRQHTLRMVNTEDKGRVWIDYLVFSPSGADLQGDIEIVDDRDARVSFNPGNAWFLGGGGGEHLETTHGTRSVDAEMVFRFEGTYIEVYGTNPYKAESPEDPITAFTVDDGTPVTYAPILAEAAAQRQRMFASPNLTAGVHTLRMVNTKQNGRVWLDYLAFVPSEPPVSTVVPTVSTPTLSPTGTRTSTIPDSSESIAGSSTLSNRLSSGAVAGIVLGCVAIFVIVIAALLWWRRKYKGNIDSVTSVGSRNRAQYLDSELSPEYASTATGSQPIAQSSWRQCNTSAWSSGSTNSNAYQPVPTANPPPYQKWM